MKRRAPLEPSNEERYAAHVIREHHRGRTIARILDDDPYLRNRLTDEARRRVLERPEVIRAVAADTAAARGEGGASAHPPRSIL